jgi:uncharacterized protein (DUF697 family)
VSTFGNPLTEYSPQMEAFEYPQGEQESLGELGGEVFSEDELMELAAELLEVTNEQELDHFLGDLIKKAGSAIGTFVRSPVGQAIGGVLKSAAKTALPIAGGALGAYVGGPLGAKIGSSLGSMSGQALGLELEGLSQEDREFEATKQFVKFAGETVKSALSAPPNIDPATAAKAAAAEAARIYAPGLYGAGGTAGKSHSGRWIRHHGKIIVLGA